MATKMLRTALDTLPAGTVDDQIQNDKIVDKDFPEGITQRQLSMDLVRIAWPSFIELVLTQLTSMADQVMVGRLPGQEGIQALSAVGLASQPKFLLMAMIIALNVGATAMIARFRGQQDRHRANVAFKMAFVVNLGLGIIFSILGVIFAEPLIRFMSGTGTITQETLQQGTAYLTIQMVGFIPLMLCFTITAALRGVGDTKTPMMYNTIANVVNLIFNYIMIYGHFGFSKMGVIGASWATIIGQTAAFVLAMYVCLNKSHYIFLDFKSKFEFDMDTFRKMVSIGIPSMIEQLFMRGGIIVYTRIVASLGDTLYATHNIVMGIQSMSFMVGQAFGNAATTMMGQCIGKVRYDMAKKYISTTRKLGIGVSFILMALLIGFNKQIMALYNSDPEVIRVGADILWLLAFTQPFQADQFVVSGGLRGAGDTMYTAIVILVTIVGVRVVLAILLINVFNMGLMGAWIALAADQLVRTFLMAIRYYSERWVKISLARSA